VAQFILASGNRHKLAEFGRILAPHRVVALPDGITLPPEKTVSFAENARDKAAVLAQGLAASTSVVASGPDLADPGSGPDVICLADDSGLEVEALGWAPGVTSSRYAGREGDDQANIAKLLAALEGRADAGGRRARFVCALDAVAAGQRHFAARGEWWGTIATAPSGSGGFGYDPVFVPEGETQTVAELAQARKDGLSHRARAARALLELLHTEGVPGV
jgi:XTP/dITP diphosphohydrolase